MLVSFTRRKWGEVLCHLEELGLGCSVLEAGQRVAVWLSVLLFPRPGLRCIDGTGGSNICS
jgi:hypothetical protein